MAPFAGATVAPLEGLGGPPAAVESARRGARRGAMVGRTLSPSRGARGAVTPRQRRRAAVDPSSAFKAGVVACFLGELLDILRRVRVSRFGIMQVGLDRFGNQSVGRLRRVDRIRTPQSSRSRRLLIGDVVAPQAHAKHSVRTQDPEVRRPPSEQGVSDVVAQGGGDYFKQFD